MSKHEITVECPIPESFRVAKVVGMFDVPPATTSREEFAVELPGADEDWTIGAIVGPSGSGKSTVARNVYGDFLYVPRQWTTNAAVIDEIGQELEVRPVIEILTAVGFSSPPAWIRPYRVLSTGQQMRCDLARALLTEKPLVVFDEFTSVVDRQVAKIGSAAVSKAIRHGHVRRKFIAVTCHCDVLEWLEPDWVLDMASGELARGRLRRPNIQFDIRRGKSALWPRFAKHHYLSGSLNPSAQCYYAVAEGQAIGICAFLPILGKKNFKRVSRIVVLPDFQGVGIGGRFLDACASIVADEGNQIGITTSHPSMIRALGRSSRWRVVSVKRKGLSKAGFHREKACKSTGYVSSAGRAVVSARFVGEK